MIQFIIASGWLAAWLFFGAAYTAGKEGDNAAAAAGGLLAGFAATTCIGFFVLNSARQESTHRLVLWVHHAAIFGLFGFTTAVEFLQLEAWWKKRLHQPVASLAETYRRLWLLTEIVPAAVAVTVFLTGLRLIWEAPEVNSPSQVWLMTIIAAFGVFFFDGLLGFRPIVRRWNKYWITQLERRSVRSGAPASPRAGEAIQIFMHFLSWPILFLLGMSRYNVANAVSMWMKSFEHRITFLPLGWAQVVVALTIWVASGLFIIGLRKALSHQSDLGATP